MERPFNWLKNNKDKIEYKAETTIFIVFVNFTNMIFFRRVDTAEFLKNSKKFPTSFAFFEWKSSKISNGLFQNIDKNTVTAPVRIPSEFFEQMALGYVSLKFSFEGDKIKLHLRQSPNFL